MFSHGSRKSRSIYENKNKDICGKFQTCPQSIDLLVAKSVGWQANLKNNNLCLVDFQLSRIKLLVKQQGMTK